MELSSMTEDQTIQNGDIKRRAHKREGNKLPQYIAALTVNISSFVHGAGLGWPSPMLPILQSEHSPIGEEISEESSSWLGSLVCLGAMFATPLYLLISHYCSRKCSGYLVAVPFAICWVLTIAASSVNTLYVARFLSGMGTGAATVFIPLYVTEIAEDSVRGTLGSFYVLICYFGILSVYILGSYTPYNVTSYIMLSASCIYVVGFFFMPESPAFHVKKSNQIGAIKSLRWLRGRDSTVIEQDLNNLITTVEANQDSVGSMSFKEMLTSRGTRRALVISLVLVANLQLSGVIPLLSYTVTIFKEAGTSISPNMSTIIVGALQIMGSLLATVLLDRAGRKVLLVISNTLMMACLAVIGAYFYCTTNEIDVSGVSWLPVACLSTYFVALALGVSPIPFLMISELFSPEARTMAVTISLVLMWLEAFLVTKFFTSLSNVFGLHGCYWIFAAVCLGGLLFSIFVVPETKNRSLDSILQELNGEEFPSKTETKKKNAEL